MWRKIVQSTYRRNSERRRREAHKWHLYFQGTLANAWAWIEEYLDLWVEHIHKNGGSAIIQAHLPASLGRRLDYLSTALREGLIWEGGDEEGARLIREIHSLKTFRHTFLHGRAIVDEHGRTIIDHSRVRGGRRIEFRTPYTKAQMYRHYKRTYDLEADLRAFLFGEDVAQTDS